MSKYKHRIPKHLEKALDDLDKKYPLKQDYDKALAEVVEKAADNILERIFRDEDYEHEREICIDCGQEISESELTRTILQRCLWCERERRRSEIIPDPPVGTGWPF